MVGKTKRRFLKPREVAIELNCNVYTIYDLLKTGQLVGIKLRTHWRVHKAELEKFIKTRGGTGRNERPD